MTSFDPWDLHRSGPWLVVALTSQGVSAQVQETVRRQCDNHGVDIEVVGIDEVTEDLYLYKGMILIFPCGTPATTADFRAAERLLDVVARYRVKYRSGAGALFARGALAAPWFKVGVVQIVGTRAVLDHPPTREAVKLRQICAVHPIDASSTPEGVDFFAVYDRSTGATPAPLPGTASQAEEQLRSARDYIRSWNIPDSPEAITHALAIFDGWVARYNGPRYRKPPGEMNRAEWILVAPGSKGPTDELAADPAESKQWQENGNNAARDLMDSLKAAFPDLVRPNGMDGKKFRMRDVSALQTNLAAAIDLMMFEPGETDPVAEEAQVHE